MRSSSPSVRSGYVSVLVLLVGLVAVCSCSGQGGAGGGDGGPGGGGADCEGDVCDIAGACYENGERHPDSDCLVCLTGSDPNGWSLVSSGTPCGSTLDAECDKPDSCDGAGSCLANYATADTPCGSSIDTECRNPDTCDGAGVCAGNFEAEGTACGSSDDTECDDPDTCDGAGACQTNYIAEGTACGSSEDTECDDPDTCDGAGSCLGNFEVEGAVCGTDDDTECDNPDSCDGTGGCATNWEDDGAPCSTWGGCQEGVCECLPGWSGGACDVCRVYVDVDATPTQETGLSWDDAFDRVQEGIELAGSGAWSTGYAEQCEVWVAEGVYYIYGSDPDSSDPLYDSVELASGVLVYGGFEAGATDISQRDWLQNRTVLSGCDAAECTNRSLHVVRARDGSHLDGFYITGGNADYQTDSFFSGSGGGMLMTDVADVTIRNCHFFGNAADENGGSMYIWNGSDVVLEDCLFTGNESLSDGPTMDLTLSENVTVRNFVAAGNRQQNEDRYGGISVFSSTVLFENGLIVGNASIGPGGGLSLYTASGNITNCVVADNHSSDPGGGIYFRTESDPVIANTVIWGNVSEDTSYDQIFIWDGEPEFYHNDIDDADYAGEGGNIQAEPGFVVPAGNTGTWTAVDYDSTRLTTVLTDSANAWTADELTGLFLQPDADSPRVFPIYGNGVDSIEIVGDVSGWVAATTSQYEIRAYTPSATSPLIDAGHGELGTTTDIEGTARCDDPSVDDAYDCTGLDPCVSYIDIGAYEFQN